MSINTESQKVVELHQFRAFWDLPNASPYCMKVETYLRFRGIKYITISSTPKKSPTGMLPFIIDNHTTTCGSTNIIDYFENQRTRHIDHDLTEDQHLKDQELNNILENTLYWQITFMRWADPQGWSVFKPDISKQFPWALRWMPTRIRKKLLAQMRRIGLTPYDTQAAYKQGEMALLELSKALNNQPYLHGNTMHSIDLSAYAFIANILDQRYSNPLQTYLQKLHNLVGYCQRIHAITYADWTYIDSDPEYSRQDAD